MLYKISQQLTQEEFKRLTGVSKKVFEIMVSSTQDKFVKRPTKRGGISKFSIQDQVLIFLEYYKENRTFFHIGATYGVNESTVYRIVTKIENCLMKDEKFSLNGKNALKNAKNKPSINAIIIDATEIQIQRPKKRNFKN
jgi:hypothetical protein